MTTAAAVTEISLDYDLGEFEVAGIGVLDWIREKARDGVPPPRILVHSQHPSRVDAMLLLADRIANDWQEWQDGQNFEAAVQLTIEYMASLDLNNPIACAKIAITKWVMRELDFSLLTARHIIAETLKRSNP